MTGFYMKSNTAKNGLKSDSHLPKIAVFIYFNESPLKMIKSTVYVILKPHFVVKILKFFSYFF